MKKTVITILLIFATMNFIRVYAENKLDKIIQQNNISVNNETKSNLDSLDKAISQVRSQDYITTDDLYPMQPGEKWLKKNWHWLLTLLIFLLEVFLRVAPTNKDWSIVNKILSILIWIFNIIPNNAKIRNDVLKRGHDLRIKKIIEAYRNK